MELLNPLSLWQADLRFAKFKRPVICLSSDTIGNPVCIRAGLSSGKWQVEKANPGDFSKIPAIGILIEKTSPTEGTIQILGEVVGIFSGLSIGKIYQVDYNGITVGIPTIGINGYSFLQTIGYAVDTDILFLTGNVFMTKHR